MGHFNQKQEETLETNCLEPPGKVFEKEEKTM